MADIPTIANLAMQKLGEEDQLTSLDEDRTAARAMRVVWDSMRRMVLRRGKFNFSIRRRELAAQAIISPTWSSPYPYSNRFPMAANFLRLIEIIEPAAIVANYKLEGGAVLADTDGPVWVRVVEDIADTTQWDDLFVEAFAFRLAFQVADRITGDRGRKADCWAGYSKAISLAAGVDAKEDPPEPFVDSSWIEARG